MEIEKIKMTVDVSDEGLVFYHVSGEQIRDIFNFIDGNQSEAAMDILRGIVKAHGQTITLSSRMVVTLNPNP